MNIEQRLTQLERTNRRLRTGLISLTIAIATVLIVGQAKPEEIPDVIKAKSFKVMNNKGKALVVLMSDDKTGSVFINDAEGEPLVMIHAAVTGIGTVVTYNGKGQKLLRLGATDDGEVGVFQNFNGKGQKLVELSSTVEGQGALATYNDKGQYIVRVGASAGQGMLSTYNGKGHELVELGVLPNGAGAVVTYNGKGQELVGLGATVNGEGSVATFNDKGQKLVGLGVLKDGGGVVTTSIGDGRVTGRIGDK